MKKITALLLILTMLVFSGPASAAETSQLVTARNGIFYAGGQRYRAVGTCLYPAHSADYRYIRTAIEQAKANGITLIRAVDIWEGVYGGGDDALYSDSVWKRVDYIIKICSENDMRVILDISTVRNFLYNSPDRRDSYDPAVFPLWSDIIEFICARRNCFTGIVYRDDPTIFSYAFAGEPVCYGGNLNDWSDGLFTSRSPDDLETSIFYVADRLRENDPNHLISSGGLLHITPKDSAGLEIYKSIWSYENIDYGALHIYPASGEGEWANLPEYAAFCSSIGKPLLMEEFGDSGADTVHKAEYLSYCFDKCLENGIDAAVFWNWSAGDSFDVFPHMTDVIEVIRQNARLFGFTGRFAPFATGTVEGTPLFSFEDGNTLFTPNTSDPGYGGAISVSNENASHGEKSLCIPVNFDTQYEWYWLSCNLPSPVSLSGSYLAADIYIPEGAAVLNAKFSVGGVQQAESGKVGNFILPGRWNTVILPLTDTDVSPEGGGFAPNAAPDLDSVNSIGLLLLNSNGTYTGDVLVDNIRTGELAEVTSELEIDTLTANASSITVTAHGGKGRLLYSYYVLSAGRVVFSRAYTEENSVALENIPAGNYNVRVYVQDESGIRKVKTATFSV